MLEILCIAGLFIVNAITVIALSSLSKKVKDFEEALIHTEMNNVRLKDGVEALEKDLYKESNRVDSWIHDLDRRLIDAEQKKAFEETLREIRTFIANQKSPVTKEKLSEETVNNYMKSIKAYLLGKELKDNPRNRRAMNLYKQFKERK